MRYDVAFVHNKKSPYREYLFSEMSNCERIEPTVYYCNEISGNRNWETDEYSEYSKNTLEHNDLFSVLDISFNPFIIKKLQRESPDAVVCSWSGHGTTLFALLAAKFSDINFIYWSAQTKDSNPNSTFPIESLKKFVLSNSDSIVVPGSKSEEYHMSLGVDRSKIFISPNIVNNDVFYSVDSRLPKVREELKNKIVILYVGRLLEKKGVADLIKAFKRLKSRENEFEIALVIIGDGRLKEELITKSEGLQDIHFEGYIKDRKVLSQYYAVADIFTLPSYEDTWGLVINEAMASGLPVITTTSTGAYADMIERGKNGFVTEPGNVPELKQKLERLIHNQNLREMMGKHSETVIQERFEVRNAIEGFERAINYADNQ